MINKRLLRTNDEAQLDTFKPSNHFNTVLYTGNGGTQRIGGYINRGAVFNGSSSVIDTGNVFSDNVSQITYSAWVSFDNLNTQNFIMFPDSGATGYGFGFFDYGNGNIYFQSDNTTNSNRGYVSNSGLYSTNEWVHFALVFDGAATGNSNRLKAYVNGSLLTLTFDGTIPATTQSSSYNLLLGSRKQGGLALKGKIDQVRIFNKALSSSEVTTLYGETHASTTISTTDIFSDNSGVALYQLDGNANDTGGVSGKFGSAAIFNGTNASLDIESSDLIQNNIESFSFWFKNKFVLGFYDPSAASSTDRRRWFINNTTNGSIKIEVNNNQYDYEQTGITEDSNWHHLAVLSNGYIYLDGTALASQFSTSYWITDGTNGTSRDTIRIGSADFIGVADSSFYAGSIDDLRFYSDVLTSTEVGYLYNNTTASIPTDNLLAYYKLDGDARDEQQLYDGTATNVKYAYDGTATNVTYQEATKFQPDLVWVKKRDAVHDHKIADSVRGATKIIESSTADAEITATGSINAFHTNGFAVGSDSSVNGNGNDFVAWCFKGGGADVLNENGSINSQVSANTDAGFSIVSYAGNNGSSATIGHGLNSAPELVIIKARNLAAGWPTLAAPNGTIVYTRRLNDTGATDSSLGSVFFNSTAPTSSVFTVGGSDEVNDGYNYIAYCFHSVDGYSKIGSYTGTGTTTTPIVETGFEPAFLMVKKTDTSGTNWVIWDNKRDTQNTRTTGLFPNSSSAEITAFDIDFLSNGFQLRDAETTLNASGGTYIYLAIAADPDTTTPTVEDSFDVVTFDTTGAGQEIITDFKPDLIWLKNRDNTWFHQIYDSIRGASKSLYSNSTSAEATPVSYLSSINDNGFTLNYTENVGNTHVAWVWKAGDHDDNLPQINTEGSIDSVVSVNAESGFSIIKYTAPSGSTTKFTAGHGLSSTPELVITRRIGGTSQWYTYSSTTGAERYLMLNSTNAQSSTITDFWGTDGMSATTIGLTNNQACYPNEEHIAYCFHSVSGYQKIGSYNGASTTNPISVGFQPRFVLIKKYTGADDWIIYDSQRGEDLKLRANQSNAEDSTRDDLDFTSTGFTLKGSYGLTNASGQSYIYLAIK